MVTCQSMYHCKMLGVCYQNQVKLQKQIQKMRFFTDYFLNFSHIKLHAMTFCMLSIVKIGSLLCYMHRSYTYSLVVEICNYKRFIRSITKTTIDTQNKIWFWDYFAWQE